MKPIELPLPPSVNHLYALTCRSGYARKYITDKGQAWFTEAGYILNTYYKKKTITTDIALYVKLYYCGRYDWDNCLKAVCDLLTKQGVIQDDLQIVFGQVEKIRMKHRKDTKVTIEIDDQTL